MKRCCNIVDGMEEDVRDGKEIWGDCDRQSGHENAIFIMKKEKEKRKKKKEKRKKKKEKRKKKKEKRKKKEEKRQKKKVKSKKKKEKKRN